jgi:NADH-quinone oxidoreductase subunit K
MIGLSHFLVVSLLVFLAGIYCVLTRRNAIGILMGVELVLNSANINYVAFAHYGPGNYDGQVFAIFVIMLAAAEAAIGLAILVVYFRNRGSIAVEDINLMKG